MANRPNRQRPSCLTLLGSGCSILFVVLTGLFAVLCSNTGRYQPRIAPPPPLPFPNGLDDYVAAGEMLKANGGTKAIAADKQGNPILSSEAPVVAKNQTALARLRSAFRKECLVPVARDYNATFPYLAQARDLARLLAAEADVKASQGKYAEAFSDGLDGFQMGDDISRGGALIHGLVRSAVQTIAQRVMVKNTEKLSAAEANEMAARIRSLLLDSTPVASYFANERDLGLSAIMNLHPHSQTRLIGDPSDNSGSGVAFHPIVWHFIRDRTLHEMETYYDALIAEARKPAFQRHPVSEPTSYPANIFVPIFDQALDKFDQSELRNRLILCTLAIRAHRLNQGRLPNSLDALGLEQELITDPYSGKPFVYRPQGGDYLLYSVGPDRKDDGGVPANEADVPLRGDLGVVRFAFNRTGTQPVLAYRRVPHMKAPVLPRGMPPVYP